MRIAIIAAKLDPLHGGAEAWTVGLAEWLITRGHEVHLIGNRAAANLQVPLENIHILEPKGDRLRIAHRLAAWLDRNSFDVVHDMGLGYTFDIFQPHCGSQLAIENAKFESLTKSAQFTKRLLSPFATRRRSIDLLAARQFSHPTASYIAVSEMVAKDLHRLERIERRQIRCIPNGVDTSRFHPERRISLYEKARLKLNISPGALAISIIAHNFRLKGVEWILRALRHAANFPVKLHALIVGGHKQAPHQHCIGNHTVSYTGPVDDVLPILAATDVYVHPTTYDACCLAVLEAMACGVSTVTTRIKGAAERVVDGHNGFVIDDPKNSANILQPLLELVDPEKRMQVGLHARRAAEKWTIFDNYRAVEELYAQRLASEASICTASELMGKPNLNRGEHGRKAS